MRFLKIILLIISINCFGQNVMTEALSNKSRLIYEDTFKYNLKNDKWSIVYYMETLNEQKKVFKDTISLINLVNKSLISESGKWSIEELGSIYLVQGNEKLNSKKILKQIKLKEKEKEKIKELKYQVRRYNNRNNEWRGWPISISKPVFSNDNEYCIVNFEFGNNGGHSELYKKHNSTWKLIGVFNRYAY